jgi:hypothetical protein
MTDLLVLDDLVVREPTETEREMARERVCLQVTDAADRLLVLRALGLEP